MSGCCSEFVPDASGGGGGGITGIDVENQGAVVAGGPFDTINLTDVGIVATNGGGGVVDFASNPPYVDLRFPPYSVVADDSTPAVALANATAINQAIVDFSGTDADLQLPQGTIYVDKIVGQIWSIKFGTGISKLTLRGWGKSATRIVQQGRSVAGEWDAIIVDGATDIELCEFTLEQGIIQIPDPGQQNHLLCLYNNTAGGTTARVSTWNIKLGKCIGDQYRILADTEGDAVEDVWAHDLEMDGEGSSIQAWAPNTVYAQFEWVDNGGQMYQCSSVGGGTSGPGPGPVGLGVAIPDPGSPDGLTWDSDTNLIGARSGVAVQRGFRNLFMWDIDIRGVRNSGLDFEPSSLGAAIMDGAWLWRWKIDNSFGNVTECASVSGNSNQQLENVTISDFTIREGTMGVRYTDDLTIENLDIQTTEPTTVTTTQLLVLRSTNNRFKLINPKLWRIGTSGNGGCLDTDGHFGDLTIEGGDILQTTPVLPVFFNGCTSLTLLGLMVRYEGAISPAGFAAVAVNVVDSNCAPRVDNLIVRNTHALAMRAAVEFQVRAPRTLSSVQVTGLTCPGEVTYGVIIGCGAASVYDQYPIIQASEIGDADLWRFEDAGGNPNVTDIYPIVAGSRALNTRRVLEGLRTPNGNVVGNLGDEYAWSPTTTTSARYQKVTQTVAGTPDNTGWQLILGSTITPAALAAGATQDYAPANLATSSFLRQATDAANSALGGLDATGVPNNYELRVLNLGPGTLTLTDADAGSVAANRFALEGAANRVIGVNGIVIVKRDNTLARWLCIG